MSNKLRAPLKDLLREVTPDDAAQGRMWDEVRRKSASRPQRRLVPAFAAVAAAACIAWILRLREFASR